MRQTSKETIDRARAGSRFEKALSVLDQEMIRHAGGSGGYYIGSHHVAWFRPMLARDTLRRCSDRSRDAKVAWHAELARVREVCRVEVRPRDELRQARASARLMARAAQLIYDVAVAMHDDALEKYRNGAGLGRFDV